MKKYISFLAITLFLSGCASYTSIRSKEGYECSLRSANQVLVMPAKVQVNTLDAAGKKERMYDYEYFLEGVIAEKLVESLQKYEIRATAVTRRELHENGIGEDFLRARDRSAALLTELYKKEMNEKEAFNINAIVQDLPKDLYKKLKGDVLAFVEYDHISKTKGARTADMMISVVGALATGRASSEPSERQLVLIYFIDAQTGSLIWSNLNQFYLEARKKEKEPNRIKEITTEILLPLKQKKKKK